MAVQFFFKIFFQWGGGGCCGEMFLRNICYSNGTLTEAIRRHMVKTLNLNTLRNIVRNYTCKSVIVIKLRFHNDMARHIVKEQNTRKYINNNFTRTIHMASQIMDVLKTRHNSSTLRKSYGLANTRGDIFQTPIPPLIKNGLTIFNAQGIWAKRGKPCAMHIFREVWNLCAFLMGSKRMKGHQPHQDCVIVLSVEKNS